MPFFASSSGVAVVAAVLGDVEEVGGEGWDGEGENKEEEKDEARAGSAMQNPLSGHLVAKAHHAGALMPCFVCLCHGLICHPIFGFAVARTGQGTVWTMEGRSPPATATGRGWGCYWLRGMVMA